MRWDQPKDKSRKGNEDKGVGGETIEGLTGAYTQHSVKKPHCERKPAYVRPNLSSDDRHCNI